MAKFIVKFISNKQIVVHVGNTLSNTKVIPEAILQGSVLSCTCFMIAIDEITSNLPQSINATLYVDDLCIFASGSIPHLIERSYKMQLIVLCCGHIKLDSNFPPRRLFQCIYVVEEDVIEWYLT